MSAGEEALREAARAESARIYGALMSDRTVEADRRPQAVHNAVAAVDTARVIQLHKRRKSA